MKSFHPLYDLVLPALAKRVGIFIFCMVLSFHSFSQTPIQGVVNTYHKVIEIVPAKACVIVEDPTGLNVNTLILLVQMKGATISTATDNTFGNVAAMGNAGIYETGTICYIIGDSVFLFHTPLNTYSPENGKVQLVQFADDLSFNITNTVTAMPWDSTTGLGGVIAIHADLSITMNASINANGSGYKGGPFLLSDGFCNNTPGAIGYVYNGMPSTPPNPPLQNGARKGEGVAFVSAAQSGGRGAPANGGGGGNNHNNSGGGGANITTGGIGGGNTSTGGCRVTLQGLGGKALDNSGGTRIFMGGGGGAGHNNNGSVLHNYGGNGGGIVFIWTNDLIINSGEITANGNSGGPSQADGAGGGGAGGTIIMNVTNYTGPLVVKALGGNGGQSDNGFTDGRCYGGGGGGSGGVIYFTGSTPAGTIDESGGAGGAEINKFNCTNPTAAGGAGSTGVISPNYIFTRSASPANYCKSLLPVRLLSFTAALSGKKVLLDWQIEQPELAKYYLVEKINSSNQRTILTTIAANQVQRVYSVTDDNPSAGNSLYRLKIIETDNSVTYSDYRPVLVNYPAHYFSVHPNPATNRITINGSFAVPVILKLSDSNGRLIVQQQVTGNSNNISLPALAPGIYILRIGDKTEKLVIH